MHGKSGRIQEGPKLLMLKNYYYGMVPCVTVKHWSVMSPVMVLKGVTGCKLSGAVTGLIRLGSPFVRFILGFALS